MSIESTINQAVSLIFNMPASEIREGETELYGKIFYSIDNDIDLDFSNSKIKCTINMTAIRYSSPEAELIGFLSKRLHNFKHDSFKVSSINKKEYRSSNNTSTVSISKSFRLVIDVDYNIVREDIKEVDFK